MSGASPLPKATDSWDDCPGCEKCEPNNGYVLRKGSWRHTHAHELIFTFAKTSDYFGDGVAAAEKSDEGCDKTRNPRNVLHFGTEPYPGAHFATMPSSIPNHYINAYTSSKGCCPKCLMPWARVVETERLTRERPSDKTSRHEAGNGVNSCGNTVAGVRNKTTGWMPTCNCVAGGSSFPPEPKTPIPCTVLDTFCGSGTTLRAAIDLGRTGIGAELNPEYAELAVERITNAGDKNEIKPLEGQKSLF